MLGGEQAGEIVVLLLDQLEELEHDPRAPLRVGGGPFALRSLSIGDGRFDLSLAGKRDLGLHLAGVGVEHVAERPEPPLTSLPPMKWPISRMALVPLCS